MSALLGLPSKIRLLVRENPCLAVIGLSYTVDLEEEYRMPYLTPLIQQILSTFRARRSRRSAAPCRHVTGVELLASPVPLIRHELGIIATTLFTGILDSDIMSPVFHTLGYGVSASITRFHRVEPGSTPG